MTPAQFLARMKKRDVAPAYLFLGTEAYQRRICREALLQAALGDAAREDAVTRYDLGAATLAEVLSLDPHHQGAAMHRRMAPFFTRQPVGEARFQL